MHLGGSQSRSSARAFISLPTTGNTSPTSRSGDAAKGRQADADARPPRIPRPARLCLLLPWLHGEVVEGSEGNAYLARATSANC